MDVLLQYCNGDEIHKGHPNFNLFKCPCFKRFLETKKKLMEGIVLVLCLPGRSIEQSK